MRRSTIVILKVIVSLALLFYLICQADISTIVEICLRVNWPGFVTVVLLSFLSLEVSCYKWQRLLRHDHIFCSMWELTQVYLIGYYFNNFLPTSIGGDAARAYWLGKERGKSLEIGTSIFVERFSGLLALVSLGIAGLTLAPGVTDGSQKVLMGGALLLALLLLGTAVVVVRKGWGRRIRFSEQMQGYLGRITRSFGEYLEDKGTLFTLVWTSVLFQFLVVLIYSQAGRALELDFPFIVLLATVPLVTLMTLLPFSLNGLGLREGGFVFFLAQAGFEKSEALSLSLLVYAISVLFSLAGGVVFLYTKNQAKKAKHETE